MARRERKKKKTASKPASKPDEKKPKPVEITPDETTPPDPGPPAEPNEHEAPTVEVATQPGLEHEAPTVEMPTQPELADTQPAAPIIPDPPEPEPEEKPAPPTPEDILTRARAKFPRTYDLDKFTGPLGMRPEIHLAKNAPPLWRDKGGIIVSKDIFAKLPDYVQERLVKHAALHMAGIVVVVPRSYGVDSLRSLMRMHCADGGAIRLDHYVIGASSAELFITESELHTELKKWVAETEEDIARVKADLAAGRF